MKNDKKQKLKQKLIRVFVGIFLFAYLILMFAVLNQMRLGKKINPFIFDNGNYAIPGGPNGR